MSGATAAQISVTLVAGVVIGLLLGFLGGSGDGDGENVSAAAPPAGSTPPPQAPRDAPAPNAPPPASGLVLSEQGIGLHAFGYDDADDAAVVASVTAVLGPPAVDEGWSEPDVNFGCGFGRHRVVNWGAFSVAFDEDPTIGRGFNQWSLTEAAPTVASELRGGVTVGDTLAEWQAAYDTLELNHNTGFDLWEFVIPLHDVQLEGDVSGNGPEATVTGVWTAGVCFNRLD